MFIALLVLSALVSAFVVLRRSPSSAATSVFLPVLLLWPSGYGLSFKGVEIDLLMAVSLPIVIAAALRYGSQCRVTILDALVLLYPLSDCASEWKANGQSSGLVALVSGLWIVLPPYLIGRVLIEQSKCRIAFARRFISLLAIVSVLSVYEYRMESNPFRAFAGALTQRTTGWLVQIRWGHGRIAGPYGHAILAGMLMICGFLFALWLYREGQLGRYRPGRIRITRRKGAILLVALLAGIWMTQSRGPWMGGVFGVLLLSVGRARNVRRSLVRMILLAGCILGLFAFVTARYTDAQQATQISQDQENAMYRRELITNYKPVVEKGGFLGWGMFFPHIDGQSSIDNEYLRIAIQQGYAGAVIFLLLIGQAGYLILHSSFRFQNPADIRFSFCLLGALTSLAMTLTTVYLGAQVVTVFFLLLGWAQALRPTSSVMEEPISLHNLVPPSRFAYRRVFS